MNTKTLFKCENKFSNYELNVYTCEALENNVIYITPRKEELGVMPIRQNITVLPFDDVRILSMGWAVYQEIGMCIFNTQSVRKIVLY